MTVLISPPRWSAPAATLALWALAAGSLVFWGLRLAAPAQQPVPPAVSSNAAAWDSSDVAHLLGAPVAAGPAAPQSAAAKRYSVLGVVADGAQRGAALIAVDGAAPRPYRIGQAVGDGYVLQSVDAGEARMGADVSGPATLTLQVPKDAPLPSASVAPPRALPGASRVPGIGTSLPAPNPPKGAIGKPLG